MPDQPSIPYRVEGSFILTSLSISEKGSKMNQASITLLKKILRIKELTQTVGLSRSSIYRLVSLGIFPAPIRIGVAAVGWDSADIDSWLAERKLSGNLRSEGQQ